MAKNFIQEGSVLTCIAPSGGVTTGQLVVIGALVVVALHDAPEGASFQGKTDGVFEFPSATGITAGAKVSAKAGGIVADGTAASFPCGKAVTAEAGGLIQVRLSN